MKSWSASAHRRKKGNIVACRERSLPGHKLLVAGGYQGGAKSAKRWEAGLVEIKQISEGSAFRHLYRLFGDCGQLAEAPEKEYLDPQMGKDVRHSEIVT